ncbi:MAG: hypothetical protein R3Y28_00840 [Candidatus Gastranaerophilales bacterium]
MIQSWTNNLDMLAQNGVIDFDASSYVLGQPARFVGNPQYIQPFVGQVPTAPLISNPQPKQDLFTPKQKPDANPAWKKLLLTAALITTVVACGSRAKKLFAK